MISTKFKIGTKGFKVSEKIVFAHADIVEIEIPDGAVPKKKTAQRWRKKAPDNLQFSVGLPYFLMVPPPDNAKLSGEISNYGNLKITDENEGLFKRTVGFAHEMGATTLVLSTGPSFTPSSKNKNALKNFVKQMDHPGFHLIWQPSGVWESEEVVQMSSQLGIIPACDPLMDELPLGKIAYFRLGPFSSMGACTGVYNLEKILEAASGYEKATIIFDTIRPVDDVRNLKEMINERE